MLLKNHLAHYFIVFSTLTGMCIVVGEDKSKAMSTKPSYKILMLTMGSASQIGEHAVLGEALQARGHEVHLVMPDRSLQIYKERHAMKGLKLVTYHIRRNYTTLMSPEAGRVMSEDGFQGNYSFYSLMVSKFFEFSSLECREMMADKNFLGRLKELDLDMVIVEGAFIDPCRYIVPYYLKLPYISYGAYLSSWFQRIPAPPSTTPPMFFSMPDDMTFLQRAFSLLVYIFFGSEIIFNSKDTTLLKEYCPEISRWSELIERSEFFINTMDYHLEWPVPTMPNTLYLPGITMGPADPLPKEIQAQADAAEKGIVIFSLGSYVGFMPKTVLLKVLDAFAQLEQIVYMSLTTIPAEARDKVPPNVHIMKWLPQNSLLAHPNTKVFITHCGNKGQYEALYHGVPMLGLPLFGDQPRNAFRVQHHGFGLTKNIGLVTSSELRDSILELLQNTSIRDNVRRRSAILHDRRMLPKEEAAFWVEHVIKHGGEHLRTAGFKLKLLQFFMLDVILFYLVIIFIAAFVAFKCTKFIYIKFKHVVRNVGKSQKDKNL